MRRIHKIKTANSIKETYSDGDLEKMRDNCEKLRDLAMIDMLALTGMCVEEMVLLNRDDIDFTERECVVFGKGDKERIVYFDARAKLHLQEYLDSRTDDNPALFVTLRAPYEHIQIGGIEYRLREMGKRLNIPKVHPHKFWRTPAIMAIDKGMPIKQLQRLLGPRRIDTTLQYAMVKTSCVRSLCMQKKHKYPPEGMDDAVQTVMLQCELWTDNNDMGERTDACAGRLGQYVSSTYGYDMERERPFMAAEDPVPYAK